MGLRRTESGISFFESVNERRARMEAWWARADRQAKDLEKELRKLDRRFRVVFIDPEAANNKPEARAPGVIPGRWHLKLMTSTINHYFVLAGPNGEYRDPELGVVEEMKRRDLWRRGALEKIRADEEVELARRKRQEETEAEARIEQTAAAYRAAKRVPGDGGEHRRFDRKGEAGDHPYAGGVSFPKTSEGGVLLPAGVEP